MTEMCQDPLRDPVERLCSQVYVAGGGSMRRGFSRRHGLKDMMTAQGIVHSNAGVLRDRLRQGGTGGEGGPAATTADGLRWADRVASGEFCPFL